LSGTNDRNEDDTRPGSNIDPKLGNTLDFYNDDMSRKAVGRLFASNDAGSSPSGSDYGESPHEPSGLVSGFDSEYRSGGDATHTDNRYPMEGTYPRLGSISEDSEMPSLRRKRGGAITQAANNNQDPLDEDGYKFSQFRKRQPLDRNSGGRNESEHELDSSSRPGARRKARTSADYDEHGPRYDEYSEPAPSRTGKVYKKIEPQRDFDQKPDPFPQRRAKSPMRAPARKPRFAIHRDEEDDDTDDDYERGAPSMRMIVIGGSLFAGIVVVAIVVFQLISLNSRLATAEEAAELSAARQHQINQLTIELGEARNELTTALAEVERLEGLQNPAAVTGGQPAGADEEPTGPQAPVRNHTVQPGQTLSGIGQIFFPGDPNGWMRIAEANGITNPAGIQVGQNLIIPD